MKVIDERETEKKEKKKTTNGDRKEHGRYRSFSHSLRAKWFCYTFKLGCLQLICKDSSNFKSNL